MNFSENDLSTSTIVVRRMCEFAGAEYRPDGFALGQVADLLTRCEYSVDPDGLLRLVQRGRVILDGDLWPDKAVHQALGNLEAARKWAVNSTVHRMKKSAARLALEESGDAKLKADVAKLPLGDMLLWLTECDQRGLRESLLEAVLTKCRSIGADLDD
jgi:hypothetical protein